MRAIAVTQGQAVVRVVDRSEPSITDADKVKLQIVRVGICGTDRELASGARQVTPPEGRDDLVIGHEMFGRVVTVGTAVTRVRPGDGAVLTVRRGCGECLPCRMHRSDMCRTGRYRERGISGLDGYQAEFVVESEAYVVPVAPELQELGVLLEPLSVAEKAIDEAVRIQVIRLPDAPATLDWLARRRCLVVGLGPVGLLAALILRLRGADVYGIDIVDAQTIRPRWLEQIGGHYLDGRSVPADRVAQQIGPVDLIVEAAGVAGVAFNLLDALGRNGIYVLTGIPGDDRPLQIPGAELLRQLVLDNQAMIGSVNAAHDHFQMAANDLAFAQARWGSLVAQLITHRYQWNETDRALRQHPPDEIKAVIEW